MADEKNKESKFKEIRKTIAAGILSLGIFGAPGIANEVHAEEPRYQETIVEEEMYDLGKVMQKNPNLMFVNNNVNINGDYRRGTLSYSEMRDRHLKSGWNNNLEEQYNNIRGARRDILNSALDLQEKDLEALNVPDEILKKYDNKSLETIKSGLKSKLNNIITKGYYSHKEGNDQLSIKYLVGKIDRLSDKDLALNASKLEMYIEKTGEILKNKKSITSKDSKLNELHKKHIEIKKEVEEKINNNLKGGLKGRNHPSALELTNAMQRQAIIEAEISFKDAQIQGEVVNKIYGKENKQNDFRESLKVSKEQLQNFSKTQNHEAKAKENIDMER